MYLVEEMNVVWCESKWKRCSIYLKSSVNNW